MIGINPLIFNCTIIFADSVTPRIRDGGTSLSDEEMSVLLERGKFLSTLSQASLFLLLAVILFGVFFILNRIKQLKKKREKNLSLVSEMTTEELETLLGDDLSEEMLSLDRMTRKEMKIIAEKELEKQGRKPGEIEYLKGPLDWDDIDENFQPRPKVIRSDFSKQIPESDEKNNMEISDEDTDSPPDDVLE